MWNEILIFTLALGSVSLLYGLFLKNRKTFLFNRIFLWTTLIFSMALPFVSISLPLTQSSTKYWPGELGHVERVQQEEVEEMYGSPSTEIRNELDSSKKFISIFWLIYGIVTFIALGRFVKNLIFVLQQTSQQEHNCRWGLKVHWVPEEKGVYSFFNHLFISKEYFDKGLPQEIVAHERVHARQFHSLDLLIMELLCCLCWFHPLVWLYRKWLKENHEFSADHFACHRASFTVADYLNVLAEYKNRKDTTLFINTFKTSSLTLKRVHMLTKNKTPYRMVKTGLIALLSIFSLLVISSFNKPVHASMTVIIDPGHGGKDPGDRFGAFSEAEVNLEIALYIEHLAKKEGKLKVVLTRKEDSFMSLSDRVAISEQQKADLFLGLHGVSSKYIESRGVKVYYPKMGFDIEKSRGFAENWSAFFEEYSGLKKELAPAGFVILREASVPVFLIDIVNSEDREGNPILETKQGREKIGDAIYQALLQLERK